MEGLSTICAGLGVLEEDDNGNPIGYSTGEYCLDNLKDLLRFLRRDDSQTREVFKQVCKWNIVGKDLIPIIEYCQDDRNLVLTAVKVLVFLTMPVEPSSNDIPQQIDYLWGLKSSITFSHVIPVILSLLESPLENLECESFTEDDWKLVQLVVTLFRNILAIQDISTQQKAGGSATQFLSLRDRFLELLFQENVMDLILVLSQHVGGSCGYLCQDNLLLLEIFHYVFTGQDPEFIAKAYLENLKEDENAKTSLNSLKCIMEEEEEKRRLTRLRNLGCYSQFSGTFTRLTLDGSKALFKGNPCSASYDALLKAHKNGRGPSKRIVWEHGRLPSTKNKILGLLHYFVDQFLLGGYNVLMQSIREDIDKEHHTVQNRDIVVFFQVAWFVTSFQYHKSMNSMPSNEVDKETKENHHADSTMFRGSICGPIAETLNETMFLVVISRWRFAFDGLKETNNYKLLSAAGSLLKIMIRMLDLVLKQSTEDSMEPKTARVLLYKLFYDQTDEGMTQFLFNMIKSFDTHKQARSDLGDLVETMHVVIRLLENLQSRGTLRVSKRSRKKKMKKDRVEELVCSNMTNQKEATGSGYEQSENATVLENKKSVDQDSGGKENEDSTQVDEPTKLGAKMESNPPEMEQSISDNACHGTDNSSGDEQPVVRDEVDFKISTLVSALGNQAIAKNLCWLLTFYKSNSPSTNHYIICMLRRICEDLELSPMLYQLSLLTSFYNILEEQQSRLCKEYANIVLFLTSLIRRMLRKMKSHPLLFVEILFWKTRKECHNINAEFILNELGGLTKEIRESRSIATNGEIGFLGGQGWTRRSIADALGDDEADFVDTDKKAGHKDEDPSRNNGVNGQENDSKEGHFDEQVSEGLCKRKSFVSSNELQGKIKDLYQRFNSFVNCSHLIANALEGDGVKLSPIQVSRTLKQLGFKLSRKRRTTLDGSPEEFRDGEATLLNMDKSEDSSSLRKPLKIRKRVHVFSEDEEQRIKDLFEQFKDHKRCSLMIAKALDSEGLVSAAKVSRKLKQLGLFVPRRKRSDTNFHLRDDGPSEISTECAHISDNETLTSFRKKRSDSNFHMRDDGPSENSTEGADNSGDETLISLKRRKTKHSSSAKNEMHVVASNDQTTTSSGLADADSQDSGRNKTEQSAEAGTPVLSPATFNNAGFAETDGTGICSGKQPDFAFVGKTNDKQHAQMHEELANELVDFEDDTAYVGPQKTNVSRRQLRMVIDLEDDD